MLAKLWTLLVYLCFCWPISGLYWPIYLHIGLPWVLLAYLSFCWHIYLSVGPFLTFIGPSILSMAYPWVVLAYLSSCWPTLVYMA